MDSTIFAVPQPALNAQRVLLRPHAAADPAALATLLNDSGVACHLLLVPHPYSQSDEKAWLSGTSRRWRAGATPTSSSSGSRIGGSSAAPASGSRPPTIGRNSATGSGGRSGARGLATEAAARLVRFGFEGLGLHKMTASHFSDNPASGRVLLRIGMVSEGARRDHYRRWGTFRTIEVYALLWEEWRG